MEERDYWYWLGVTEELGGAAAGRLLALYGDPESVFREKELPIGGGQQAALEESRKKLDELLRERDAYEKAGIHWCHRMDPRYPKRLQDIPDPPIILFWRGELPPEEEKTAAVIGARRCSVYGRSMAERFGSALAKEGVAVISGMAMGIDGYAQSAAVNAGGRSFAVLGCGVDQAYPAVNRPLYESLLTAGGVISEYKPGTPPLPYHFPARNRIISGLCDVLLVIEARKVSGTLITVDQALEQGRDVLALPGRLDDPLSEGCNQLIRQGAGILTAPGDALAALGLRDAEGETKEREAGEKARKQAALTAEQRAVFRALSFDPTHLEEIMRKTGFSLGEISLILMVLEEFGLARPVSGGQYVRT